MHVQAGDGVTLEIEEQGAGDSLLLIHGAITFDGCRPLLAQPPLTDRYRVIHYYRRGYGQSADPPDGFSIRDQASDARAVLERLCVKRAHVLGHSIGAVIALQLAMDAPDLVRSLVLVEPTYATRPEVLLWFQGAVAPVIQAYSTGDRRAAAEHMLRLLDGEAFSQTFERAFGGDWFDSVAAALDVYFRVELPAAVAWALPPDRAARITQPTLALVGGASLQQFGDLADDVVSVLPDARVAVVPSATHNVMACRPEAAATAIANFVSAVPGKPARFDSSGR